MQTIKKYSNRKLYHTNRKRYITLEGIAALIQAGEQVQVTDNETGEDITAPILAQVVLQARGGKSSLPTHVLTGLIQTSGDTLAGLGRSVWTALSGATLIDAEIKRRVQQLHDEGTIDDEEAAHMLGLLVNHAPASLPALLPEVPSSNDIARLHAQVDALTSAVEQLLAERKGDE